jgi:hypothetical protein
LPTRIDGEHVLYHYLQKDLLKKDIWLFQMLAVRLVTSLGIWFDPLVYDYLPVLRPYVVRDPDARGHPARGIPDQWGTPNGRGEFRDDNSLLKQLAKPLDIRSDRNEHYRGRRIGGGFVAAHVWRELADGTLASRQRLTNSFVPNLVWLPAQVAKLTDREGSFAQTFLQALSRKIYAHRPLVACLQPTVEKTWEQLPLPFGIPEEGLPEPEELNFFVPTPSFFRARLHDIDSVLEALTAVEGRRPIVGKVVSQRYSQGLGRIAFPGVADLRRDLQTFATCLRTALPVDSLT